jgi:hypothetical protein
MNIIFSLSLSLSLPLMWTISLSYLLENTMFKVVNNSLVVTSSNQEFQALVSFSGDSRY